MRWIGLIFFCMIIWTACADPDPKKYKLEQKESDKHKNTSSSLTDEERKFLREVEAKFGVKPDTTEEIKRNDTKANSKSTQTKPNLPFPAVIAIEIVNDTETNSSSSKGKRTIDANLGYGYQTNNGYSYTYFGKSQDKGKFMVYPYSQEDIPPQHKNSHSSSYSYQAPKSPEKTVITDVEIKPSQAYELVPTNDNKHGYQYNNGGQNSWKASSPAISTNQYNRNSSPASSVSTLYTTYNGHQFSGLSKQFPNVMPNYLVDPSQLLKTPQYQNAGLTPDYVHSHEAQLEQRVVPVLVLRVPSSFIKNPAAELYADFSPNYLSSLNLQDLVNQYFQKIGFSIGPQVMTYQNSPVTVTETPTVSAYEHYSNIQPQSHLSYTQAQHSGIQYSAVPPTVAKFPSSHISQQQYLPPAKPLYQQPVQQQNYEVNYQYVAQQTAQPENYYSNHQNLETSQRHNADSGHDANAYTQYAEAQQNEHGGSASPPIEYGPPQQQTQEAVHIELPQSSAAVYETSNGLSAEYGAPKIEEYASSTSSGYVSTEQPPADQKPVYGPPKELSQYYTSQQSSEKDTNGVYPGKLGEADLLNYYYQQQVQAEATKPLVLTENYPSKDHTIATILPSSFNSLRNQNVKTVQTVNYVTPEPHFSKYQSPYKIMGPQMYLKNPSSEKVSYVTSQSFPGHYSQEAHGSVSYTPDQIYTVAVRSPSTYPRKHYTHPKRMAKPSRPEGGTTVKKHTETTESRKTKSK